MKIDRNAFDARRSNWVSGSHDGYTFEAKVFAEPSMFGIPTPGSRTAATSPSWSSATPRGAMSTPGTAGRTTARRSPTTPTSPTRSWPPSRPSSARRRKP